MKQTRWLFEGKLYLRAEYIIRSKAKLFEEQQRKDLIYQQLNLF